MKNQKISIGNYIQITKEKEKDIIEFPETGYENIFKLTAINEDEDEQIEIRNDIENIHSFAFLEEIEPIEISKDWLLKLEFKKENEYHFEKGDFVIEFVKDRVKIFLKGCRLKIMYDILFVHQLQNIYSAFMEDELSMSL